jgi:hypothetical protein
LTAKPTGSKVLIPDYQKLRKDETLYVSILGLGGEGGLRELKPLAIHKKARPRSQKKLTQETPNVGNDPSDVCGCVLVLLDLMVSDSQPLRGAKPSMGRRPENRWTRASRTTATSEAKRTMPGEAYRIATEPGVGGHGLGAARRRCCSLRPTLKGAPR